MKKAISTFLVGSIVSQLTALAILPLLTRYYDAVDIGILATFVTFFSLFSPVLALRYESFYVVEPKAAASRLTLARRVALFLALLVSLIYSAYLFIAGDIKIYEILLYTVLLAITMIFYSFFSINKSILLVENDFKTASIAQNSRVSLASITKIVLIPFGAIGLIISEVLGSFSSYIFSYRKVKFLVDLKNQKNTFWSKKYTIYESLAIAFNQCFMFFPTLFIGFCYSMEEAAFFWLAYKIVSLPNTQLGTAISDAYFRHFSELLESGSQELKRIVLKLIITLSIIGFVYYGIIFYFGGVIFTKLFGLEWLAAGEIASIICCWRFFSFIFVPVSRVIIVLGKQVIRLWYDVISLLITVILMIFSYYSGLTLYEFSMYLSFVCALLYCVLGCVILFLINRKCNESFSC